tara:strand:+ start:458 stop:670 length:213 start_codon:yes stop_codon:yes gene_type:complete
MNNEIELLSDEEEQDLIFAHEMTGEPIEKLREWRKAKILEDFQEEALASWNREDMDKKVSSFTAININVH